MAEACSDETYEVLNPFQVLVSQIGAELDRIDVKVIKNALFQPNQQTEGQLICEIDTSEFGCGSDLISLLLHRKLIAPKRLKLLKDLLKVTNSYSLLEKVKKFEETNLAMERSDCTTVHLYLVLPCKRQHLSDAQIDKLKQEICHCINMKELTVDRLAVCLKENSKNKDTTIARFQFPENLPYGDISETLSASARRKETWLTDNRVIQLRVDGESSINIEETVDFAEGEFILAKKPRLQAHKENLVDVILVVEMPTSVTPSICKTVLNECQHAVQVLSESQIDMNLAVVKYGNHSSSQQPIAGTIQEFCKDFSISSKLKEDGQCGGGGNSGMADALAEVVELTHGDKMRPESSKVCIMISFLSKKLDHYRCSHGNDVIKLTNTLAQHEIPLYILGVHGNAQRGRSGREGKGDEQNMYFEECFLNGICHIGGGRYLKVLKDEVAQVNQMISDVVKNDLSIENHSEITGEVVRDALNNRDGDVNDTVLANDVSRDSRLKSLPFDKLLQNGRSLDPVTRVVRRVAFADDLNDAIESIERIQVRKDDHDKSVHRGTALSLATQLTETGVSLGDMVWRDKGKCPEASVMKETKDGIDLESADASAMKKAKEPFIDLEMASRIVKRHLHRMAYYKKKA